MSESSCPEKKPDAGLPSPRIPEPCQAGSARPSCGADSARAACAAMPSPLDHFSRMIPNCLAYARQAKEEGRPIVGIFCEYTPRELILAAGAVPVSMCGGSEATIADAETELPSNLCPLIKSSYGYAVKRSNPFLEMADLLVAETTCDGKKKMYELLSRRKEMYILELPQKPDTRASLDHWRREIREFKETLENRFHVRITPAKLRSAIRVMNHERDMRRRIAELMMDNAPPLTGRDVLLLKSSISGLCTDFAQYRRLLDTMTNKSNEDAARRIRVLLTGVPIPHGAERVMGIIEDSGGLVVCQETCTGLKPILEDVDDSARDLLDALARKYLRVPCSCMTPNTKHFDMLSELVRWYRPEVIVDLVWMACHTYNVESDFVRRLCEEKWNLPYLKIETDYSPSDTARIAVRVEATLELAKEKRKTAASPDRRER